MWKRKELKKKARHNLRKHYWKMILICLILAYVAGEYSLAGTTTMISAYDNTKEIEAVHSNLRGGTSNADIVNEAIGGITKVENEKNEKKYSRGVFSRIFNNITASNSAVFGLLNSFNEMVFNGRVMYGTVLISGTLLILLLWFLVINPLKVNANRFFMEASVHEKVPIDRLFFVFNERKMLNVAGIMALRWLYTVLWFFTLVGGVIKYYSYSMIPFILAENPGIPRKDAFILSRQMMRGNKWRLFILNISFVLWELLSIFTGGLLGIFFVNPYTTATKAEFYYKVRQGAVEKQLSGSTFLNDTYMTAVSESRIKKEPWLKYDYNRKYSVSTIILLFFTFSIIGWLWEVGLHLHADGFINRGVQHGPWLPIYGSGGVLLLLLLKRIQKYPLATFGGTVVICGVLEYVTSYCLEVIHHGTKWWDYSGYFLNLDGRVCAEGLLVFGLGGCGIIYFAAPFFDRLYEKIHPKIKMTVCVFLVVIFSLDVAYSAVSPNEGRGITDYKTHTGSGACYIAEGFNTSSVNLQR